MAVDQQVTARDVGRAFVETVGCDPMVEGVFVEADDKVIVWLLTRPIDFDDESRFYEAGAMLHRSFQDSVIDFRLINPTFFDPKIELIGDVIPSSAVPVRLAHEG